jgi:hypothetical protein
MKPHAVARDALQRQIDDLTAPRDELTAFLDRSARRVRL